MNDAEETSTMKWADMEVHLTVKNDVLVLNASSAEAKVDIQLTRVGVSNLMRNASAAMPVFLTLFRNIGGFAAGADVHSEDSDIRHFTYVSVWVPNARHLAEDSFGPGRACPTREDIAAALCTAFEAHAFAMNAAGTMSLPGESGHLTNVLEVRLTQILGLDVGVELFEDGPPSDLRDDEYVFSVTVLRVPMEGSA